MVPGRNTIVNKMMVSIYKTNQLMGDSAAAEAEEYLNQIVSQKGGANIIFATANSQLTFFKSLKMRKLIDWSKINIFHMDEYIGLPPGHPALFQEMLRKHLIAYLSIRPKSFFTLPVQAENIEEACMQHELLLKKYPPDICIMGIGENGHIAFNDPPYADFDDKQWVKIVKLDEISRIQQVKEGHFQSIEDIPSYAMTLSIPALLSAKKILCLVPEERKAAAVREVLFGPVTENCPGSILRNYEHVHMFLDQEAASLILNLIQPI